jgi:hypothetical protein
MGRRCGDGRQALAVYMRRLCCMIESDPDNPRDLLTVRGYSCKTVSSSELGQKGFFYD